MMSGNGNLTDPGQLPELSLEWIRNTELLEVPEGARRLLEHYGKIPRDDVKRHINQVVSISLHDTTVLRLWS